MYLVIVFLAISLKVCPVNYYVHDGLSRNVPTVVQQTSVCT
jgi:hypothetical protein